MDGKTSSASFAVKLSGASKFSSLKTSYTLSSAYSIGTFVNLKTRLILWRGVNRSADGRIWP